MKSKRRPAKSRHRPGKIEKKNSGSVSLYVAVIVLGSQYGGQRKLLSVRGGRRSHSVTCTLETALWVKTFFWILNKTWVDLYMLDHTSQRINKSLFGLEKLFGINLQTAVNVVFGRYRWTSEIDWRHERTRENWHVGSLDNCDVSCSTMLDFFL